MLKNIMNESNNELVLFLYNAGNEFVIPLTTLHNSDSNMLKNDCKRLASVILYVQKVKMARHGRKIEPSRKVEFLEIFHAIHTFFIIGVLRELLLEH